MGKNGIVVTRIEDTRLFGQDVPYLYSIMSGDRVVALARYDLSKRGGIRFVDKGLLYDRYQQQRVLKAMRALRIGVPLSIKRYQN